MAKSKSEDLSEESGNEEEESITQSLWLLQVTWQNEKNAPELLKYERDTIDEIKRAIEKQESRIDEINESYVNEENNENEESNGNENEFDLFAVHIYGMEIERIKYVLNSYLRVRIFKIQKYILHISSHSVFFDQTLGLPFLSKHEMEFANAYLDLCERHFQKSFLNAFPKEYSTLIGTDTDNPNVTPFKMDKFVFFKANENIGKYVLNEDRLETQESQGNNSTQPETVNLEAGHVIVAKYSALSKLLHDGYVDLV